MRAIGRWIGHLIGAMVRGFLVLGVLALIVSGGISTYVSKSLPTGMTLAFVIAISLISGLLGAFVMLAWRLSHIGDVARLGHGAMERLSHYDNSAASAHTPPSAEG